MARHWIDFRELKCQLKFEQLLDHYRVQLTTKGEQATGFCPLPTHIGNGRTPSFSVNLIRGVWQCFGCGAKGNALDFAIRMEGLSPDNPSHVRSVALQWRERLVGVVASPELIPRAQERSRPASSNSPNQPAINAPLDFELKGLRADHPYLTARGLERRTVDFFGLGYCSRGLMDGRVVVPLHNERGQLIGYAGRLVNDSAIGRTTPKYLLPGRRERRGIVHEFHKSRVLYNAHRIGQPVADLVVVEGFPSVWWLWQCGIGNVVALMGSSCSSDQGVLIASKVEPKGRVLVVPDGDDAGRRCAQSVFETAGAERSVRWIKLPESKQPTDLSEVELTQLLK